MKLYFLGGADEVGASMLLAETEAGLVVVDCGARMSARASSSLPDLSPLDGRDLRAIVLTHAHLDHSGCLPLLHSAFPRTPVYSTPPTRALLRVLLLDAVKIMEERLGRESELPLYPIEAVESLLARIETVPFGGSVLLGNKQDLKIRLLPAGHILGAAMAQLSGPETSLLVTGDISMQDQYTVPGLAIPPDRSTVMVAESTYGGRLHTDRKTEENRFIAKVREVLSRGGKMLVPAFALGRAQELILILLRAMRKGELAPVRVHVDGMVKNICKVYADFPNYLPPFARRLTEKHGSPFFGVLDNISPVLDPREREAIVSGEPCVVVSSSGMLSGGASVFYATRLAGAPANCIALTGYQDEEAPGRRLLELADGESNSILLNGREVQICCEVTRYALSAHIDGHALLQFAARMNPEATVWVHGDGQARDWLHQRQDSGRSHLVRSGEVLEFRISSKRKQKAQTLRDSRVLGDGEGCTADRIPLLAEALRREGRESEVFRSSNLLDRWHGEGRWGNEEQQSLHDLLENVSAFEPVVVRGETRYRLRTRDEALALVARSMGPANPQQVADAVDRLFPRDSGCYRAKRFDAEQRVSLCFHFPKKAELEFPDSFEALQSETGWQVEVYPHPHLEQLFQAARRLVGQHVRSFKTGFNASVASVTVKTSEALPLALAESLTERFRSDTGYCLSLTTAGAVPPSVDKAAPDPKNRMEINEAFEHIKRAFEGSEIPPLKTSKRQGPNGLFIELRFVTPFAGMHHAERIERLAGETGWPISLSQNLTPDELQRLALGCVSDSCDPLDPPSIRGGDRTVVIRCTEAPSTQKATLSSQRLEALTGFRLRFDSDRGNR